MNLRIMLFFDQYLASKGLEGQYTLVYGSVMGAVHNNTVLAHTSDVGFGFTPIVAQFLEQDSTKEELFSYGYSLWADTTVWRMCPHQHHPSPDFQRLMQEPLAPYSHYKHGDKIGFYAGTCWLDGFLIWPVPNSTTDCTVSDPSLDMERILGHPLNQQVVLSDPNGASYASAQLGFVGDGTNATGLRLDGGMQGRSGGTLDMAAAQTFCVHHGCAPIQLRLFSRPPVVDGYRLPAPEDMEGQVVSTYGLSWRTPDVQFHGADPSTPDVDRIRRALHERLSVTVWGDTPWALRRQRCGMQP